MLTSYLSTDLGECQYLRAATKITKSKTEKINDYLLSEIEQGLKAIEYSENKRVKSTVKPAALESQPSRIPNNSVVGFISVFASDQLGAGWVAGHTTELEADQVALETCNHYSANGTCKNVIHGRSRCVGVAVGSLSLGAAGGDTAKDASDRALKTCREAAGNSNCVAHEAVCQGS